MVLAIQDGDILTLMDGVGTIGGGIMDLDGTTGDGITDLAGTIGDTLITDGITLIMDIIIIITITVHGFTLLMLLAEENHTQQIQQEYLPEVILLTEPILQIDSAQTEHLCLQTPELITPTTIKLQQLPTEEVAVRLHKTTATADQAVLIPEVKVLHQDLTVLHLLHITLEGPMEEAVVVVAEA